MPDEFGNLTPEEIAALEAKKASSHGASGAPNRGKPATESNKTVIRKDKKSAQSIGGSQSSGENTTLSPTKGTDFEKRELPGTKTVNVNDISGVNKNSNAGNEVIFEETESKIKNAGSTSGITSLEMGGGNNIPSESDGVIGDLVHDANNSNPAGFLNPLELGGGGDGTEAESLTSSTSAPVIGGDYDPTADVEQAQKEAERKLNEFVKEQLDANPFLALVEWDITTTVAFQPIEDYSGVPTDERNNLAQLEWEEYSSLAGVPTEYRDDVMIREQELAEQERLAELERIEKEQQKVAFYNFVQYNLVSQDVGEWATQSYWGKDYAHKGCLPTTLANASILAGYDSNIYNPLYFGEKIDGQRDIRYEYQSNYLKAENNGLAYDVPIIESVTQVKTEGRTSEEFSDIVEEALAAGCQVIMSTENFMLTEDDHYVNVVDIVRATDTESTEDQVAIYDVNSTNSSRDEVGKNQFDFYNVEDILEGSYALYIIDFTDEEIK